MKTHTFHVTGTHCASCKILIEDVLNEHDFVNNAEVNLKTETVLIETNTNQGAEEIVTVLTEKIEPHGYMLSMEKIIQTKKALTMIM